MAFFACTLLSDGTSDRVLKPILDWLLDEHCPVAHELQFAERLHGEPKGLGERINAASRQYPCDLLFVHRDAEAVEPELRREEIASAWRAARANGRFVSVVPVRMTEAWLLTDPTAIRAAAGNPLGAMELKLPALHRLESIRDPKEELFQLLREASGLPPGRLRAFSPQARQHRISELMDSFELLRKLPSFQRLEADLMEAFQG